MITKTFLRNSLVFFLKKNEKEKNNLHVRKTLQYLFWNQATIIYHNIILPLLFECVFNHTCILWQKEVPSQKEEWNRREMRFKYLKSLAWTMIWSNITVRGWLNIGDVPLLLEVIFNFCNFIPFLALYFGTRPLILSKPTSYFNKRTSNFK